MNHYEITISPDPLFYVRGQRCKYNELLYMKRSEIIYNVVVNYLKHYNTDFFIELHFELSPQNRNFHAHGYIKTFLEINQEEFIDVIACQIQRPYVKNRLAAVRIGKQKNDDKERQEYWSQYINKSNIVPTLYGNYRYKNNKWSKLRHNELVNMRKVIEENNSLKQRIAKVKSLLEYIMIDDDKESPLDAHPKMD